jgi:CDP-diacylglycerol--glycerol-3-phosphate 3-phosphatidyltransferase
VSGIKHRLRWLPNAITIARLASLPVLLWWCIVADGPSFPLGIFFGAIALTDLLDGRLAALLDARTPLGRVLDPLADRLLMVVGLIGILLINRFAWPAVAIILARDLAAMAGFAFLARKGVLMEIDFAGKVSSGFNMGCVAFGLAISSSWVDVCFWCAVGLSVLTFMNYAGIAVGRLRALNTEPSEVTSSPT